jgi:hypothetical protein
MMRRSFAVYYYTKEAPEHWNATVHSTIFKARPDEWMKGNLAMPIESAMREAKEVVDSIKKGIKGILNK